MKITLNRLRVFRCIHTECFLQVGDYFIVELIQQNKWISTYRVQLVSDTKITLPLNNKSVQHIHTIVYLKELNIPYDEIGDITTFILNKDEHFQL